MAASRHQTRRVLLANDEFPRFSAAANIGATTAGGQFCLWWTSAQRTLSTLHAQRTRSLKLRFVTNAVQPFLLPFTYTDNAFCYSMQVLPIQHDEHLL